MDDDMYYYEDIDDITENGYAEQLMYERYLAASATGQRYVLPQNRHSIGEHGVRCLEQLVLQKNDTGLTTLQQLLLLMISCLFVLIASFASVMPRFFVPMVSLFCGMFVLFEYFGGDPNYVYLIFGYATLVYLFMYGVHNVSRRTGVGWRVTGLCFFLTVLIQFLLTDKLFLRIRGVMMIMTMKLISLAFDVETNELKRIPGIFDFYAYCFGVTTVIFGPWMPFKDHLILMKRKQFQSLWKPIWKGLFTFVLGFMALAFSSCYIEWFIPDDYDYYSVWLIAFRDAMAFRYSHYFISLTSEGSVYLSGYFATPIEEDVGDPEDENDGTQVIYEPTVRGQRNPDEEYSVSNVISVEISGSLVNVVKNWNIPMHAWLKKYIYTTVYDGFGLFWAILFTFGASSLLHGFNFQISAVLLSLGFYTYAEKVLRTKLASAFRACILPWSCRRGCGHVHDSWNFYVIMANCGFFLLSVFHLTYLGMVFDSSESQEEGYNAAHTINKWSQLNFASHSVAAGMFVFAKIV